MDRQLNTLKNILLANLIKIGGKECANIIKNNEESLFLTIAECGLKWQKKKVESLFDMSSIHKDNLEPETFKAIISSEYVSECLKPSKKEYFFINLSGLYYLESKRNSNLKILVVKLLQNSFYKEMKWVLKDEEKLIVSLLILFNAFNKNNAFNFSSSNENIIWDFMKNNLAKGLTNIGVCVSFQDKIEAKSTKYRSGKSFMSGQPSILSRTGLFVPNNGTYHLELITDADFEFLVTLLFDGFGYTEKLAYVELIEQLGRDLFMESILTDIFSFNEKLRKIILH